MIINRERNHHPIADGVHQIAECDERSERIRSRTEDRTLPDSYPEWDDVEWHGRNNAYLFEGEQTLLYETLSPLGRDIIHQSLDQLLDGLSLDYLLISHTDQPHCGNTRSVIKRYPDCTLLAPDYGQPDELYLLGDGESVQVGETLDIGGFEFEFIEAFFLDAAKSIWLYERTTGALFTADWLKFPHTGSECLHCLDEVDREVTVEHLRRAHVGNFTWWQVSDLDTIHADIELLAEEWQPEMVSSTHGLTIRGQAAVNEYLDRMKAMAREMRTIRLASMEGVEG